MAKKTYVSLGSLVARPDALFSKKGRSMLTGIKRVTMLWHATNGDFERKHTCGLFLRDPQGKEKYPTLVVYIDSNVLLQDFRTNKHIYLSRLASQDLLLHDIQFLLSKEDRRGRQKKEKLEEKTKKQLPELTNLEMAEIQDEVSRVDEGMREKVLETMILSYRRQKSLNTEDETKKP